MVLLKRFTPWIVIIDSDFEYTFALRRTSCSIRRDAQDITDQELPGGCYNIPRQFWAVFKNMIGEESNAALHPESSRKRAESQQFKISCVVFLLIKMSIRSLWVDPNVHLLSCRCASIGAFSFMFRDHISNWELVIDNGWRLSHKINQNIKALLNFIFNTHPGKLSKYPGSSRYITFNR